ncbi:MAG: 1-acyl-sn-glycerol-3-phosphate acyltransferase [Synergistaceae bacterium]|jgi:1-acyl-sn-glycerol-3-phosphate acyltransferase|nr:1-acyl-sn-glycerol-3-phosphate acyltransferase [Synergistaceae bacterium]
MFTRAFYSFTKTMFRVFFRLYNRLEIHGLGNIPAGTAMIVASNHASYIDPPLIGGVFPGRLRYLAKESLFRAPILGFFIRILGAVPVTREDSQKAGVVMKMLLGFLKNHESVLLFPEGSRTPDGRIKPLEAGAAFLAVRAGVPLLPVYVGGSFRSWPRGQALPRPSKLTVTVSPPIYPDEGIENEKARRASLQKALEEALLAMEEASDCTSA